jgi:hypothetical protein
MDWLEYSCATTVTHMQRAFRSSLSRAAFLGSALLSMPAFAHIDLVDPPARAHGTAASNDPAVDTNTDQKSGPCGQVQNGRTDRVTTYAPGETIRVQVREETSHDSYIRVSIDLDGDNDFPLRQGQISPETQDQAQAAEDALGGDTLLRVYRENNNNNNFVHEIEVTLPNQTCDNCTLQVIQLMYDTSQVYYFQCADIVISDGTGSMDAGSGASGSSGTGTAGNSGAAAGAGGASSAGAGGQAATTGGSGSSQPPPGGTSSTSAGAAGSGPDLEDGEEASDDGGCSLRRAPQTTGTSEGLASLAALSLGLALWTRRRTAQR